MLSRVPSGTVSVAIQLATDRSQGSLQTPRVVKFLVNQPHKIGVITLAPIYHMGILSRFGSCLVVVFVSLNKLPLTERFQLNFFRTKLSANGVLIYRKWSRIFETMNLSFPDFSVQSYDSYRKSLGSDTLRSVPSVSNPI